MTKQTSIILAILFSFLTLTSCRTFQKLLKSNDYETKYVKAIEYYNLGKYDKALLLLEQLVPVYKGMEKGEDVFYYYSQTNYKMHDYILGGYYFRKFASTYPNSKYTEECMFLSAYCYYLDSPKPSLDQDNTNQAINEFEMFLSKFPNTTKKDTCNICLDKLRNKLQQKSYNNAILYYNLGYYRAATISLKNSLKDYPDSPFKEELHFYIAEAAYLFARNSIESKKLDRYKSALKEINVYLKNHPEGKFAKDANKIFKSVNNELSKKQTIN